MSLSSSRTLLPFSLVLVGFLVFTMMPSPVVPSVVHASTRSDLAAGRMLFHEKGCEQCHGVDGVGGEKGPSLSGVGRKWKPADIEKQIVGGGGGMPAFADVLASDEVKALVDYLAVKKTATRTKAKAATRSQLPAPKPDSGGSDDQ